MAILPAEPSLYPETLFEHGPRCKGESHWWVMHTRPRQEKALARSLHGQGVPFFMPLQTKRTRIRGKDIPSHLPLFPGYLFLYGDQNGLVKAMSTQRVARSLEVVDQTRLWQELRQLHRLLLSGRTVTPELSLMPGAPVEIRSGPLMGLRGVIVRGVSGNRFVVQVNFIQRGASVLLEGDSLECSLN